MPRFQRVCNERLAWFEFQVLLMERLLDRLSPEPDEPAGDELVAELERRKADVERGAAGEIPWSVLREEN